METKLQVKKLAEFKGHQHPIYTIIAAPEPGRFFSAGGDKIIVEWNIHDPENGVLISRLPFTIYSLCLLGTSGILAAGTSEGGIHFIDLNTKTEIRYIQLKGEGVFDIQYSNTHQMLVASTAKGQLLFIDPDNCTTTSSLQLSDQKIRSIAFNELRPYLYVACSDSNVYVIDLVKKEKVYQFTGHNWASNAIYYQEEKDELITASKDAHIRIWDIKNQFELIKSVPAHNYAIYKMLYNPDLKIYATASRDKTIKL